MKILLNYKLQKKETTKQEENITLFDLFFI